jgi:hypothetical protein
VIDIMATPAGIEPATFSLEGTCGSCDFKVRSDKSTVFRAIEPKRLSAAVRMKANDSTAQYASICPSLSFRQGQPGNYAAAAFAQRAGLSTAFAAGPHRTR